MPEQLSLLELGAPTRPTDRLFFAIFPEFNAASRTAELAKRLVDQHGLKGRPLAAERFHITLHHFGDYHGLPPRIASAARQAAETIAVAPFNVTFDRVMSFRGRPGNRPFVLRGGDGLAALMAFQSTLGAAMTKAGLKADVNFTPHVTLLYDDRILDEQPVETITWTVREFVLIHSLLGQTRHIPLARWPFRG